MDPVTEKKWKKKRRSESHGDAQRGTQPRLHNLSSPSANTETGGRTVGHLASGQQISRFAQLQKQRAELPIFSVRADLIREIKDSKVVVIIGETGSGKTTQSGLCGSGKIAVTQPRRVAAISVAQRVADERGVKIGQEIGYCVRFDDQTSHRTAIKYLTDGMLLREAMLDPLLSQYSVIILDEAHERSGLQQKRSELRIIAMSAAMDVGPFAEYFGAEVLYIKGRQYPVDRFYVSEKQEDYLDAALVACLKLHKELPQGDILCFLPGREDIEHVHRMVESRAAKFPADMMQVIVCPIYAALAWEDQRRVFDPAPPGVRKLILATNIAETSITIPRVRYVIDPGFVKARGFDGRSGLELLRVIPVSKAQAIQRAGRAGRDGPGVCFRLYTEDWFTQLPEVSVPEIKRANLASVLLQLKVLGVNDPLSFDFLDRPPHASLKRGLSLLLHLGALSNLGDITPLGKQMSALPLDPMYSRTVLASLELGCAADVLTIIAMLGAENIFVVPKDKKNEAAQARANFSSPYGDHMALLSVWNSWNVAQHSVDWCYDNFISARAMKKVSDIREQLVSYCKNLGKAVTSAADPEAEAIRKSFVAGFFLNTAIRQPDGKYKNIMENKEIAIHPASSMFNAKRKPECVLYNSLVQTTKTYMREITAIDPSWLLEMAPHVYGKRAAIDAPNPMVAGSAAAPQGKPAGGGGSK